ncbi:DUF4890 domain-containing protein [Pedobacter sp. BS3]|uniref:DUF4890 domain-containing protein n=1 Tax=Pedobacter sp. BS3 TaxID=2567937 RepID=UPI0011EE05F2|nr:DUF4890 domain-containing protein [Pedobacter sp. BS3]TZF84480.1 DUF4890 domain-containing protein [Pedobacter sp. BS3]
MKKLILALALITGFSTITFAQQDSVHHRMHRTPEQMAQFKTDAMSKKLSLTADQKAKIYDINLAAAKNVAERAKGAKSDFKTQMKETDQKINSVLTAEQQKTYADWKAERAKKMHNHFKGHGTEKGNTKSE